MGVAIVDYGSGNLRSAAKAFERALEVSRSPRRVQVTAEPEVVARAEAVVLPGVGAFADCLRGVEALPGMGEALQAAVIERGRPFLGICVGMQLMASRGLEHGEHPGFGWIAGEVVPLTPSDPALKVPHMGWNELEVVAPDHPLFAGIESGSHVYFVHSYHFACRDQAAVLARADHGGPLCAALCRDNLAGTQFHPEKSQATGLRFIANFLGWRP
jgi:glutamine amidotransferase